MLTLRIVSYSWGIFLTATGEERMNKGRKMVDENRSISRKNISEEKGSVCNDVTFFLFF